MFQSNFLFALVCAFVVTLSHGFAPTYSQASSIKAASPLTKSMMKSNLVLRMSDEQEPSKISADGTFYDDELDSAPVKQGISDSMKARLMAEANTGLDSNSKQTNVLLYICVGVAVLVALGGSGILY